MTDPCTKEAEIARIDERTLNTDRNVTEIHKVVVGTNGDGLKGRVKSVVVQVKIQWGLMVVMLGLIAWVLRT